ncbi:hypothetical protein PBY51_014786 [Eleginops maclovinus]|uniref:Uncharacterized protein n=1 Tax=Eleginops maclovinus TaxID=56733 RepID=A0AAN7WX03_ELEMC|nr:hypothetical protein PBY51_014786 [Eleginops maclovinus]
MAAQAALSKRDPYQATPSSPAPPPPITSDHHQTSHPLCKHHDSIQHVHCGSPWLTLQEAVGRSLQLSVRPDAAS